MGGSGREEGDENSDLHDDGDREVTTSKYNTVTNADHQRGSVLQPPQSMAAQSPEPMSSPSYTSAQPPPQWPSPTPSRALRRSYFNYGVLSAVLSLFFLSEIFGSVAIILGAHTWKKEEGNRGLTLLILGIICMLVGIYFTAYPLLIDLLLPA